MRTKAMKQGVVSGLLSLSLMTPPGLVHNETKLWPASPDGLTRISLCWMQTGFTNEREVILNAIRGTWQRTARIKFIDKGSCAGVTGSKVSISLQRATTNNSDAQTSGVGVLASSVTFWLPAQLQFERLRYLAVHEFGHVLGFQHEEDSPLRDAGCSAQDAWGNVNQLGGVWDRLSIMNSGCNTFSNAVGYLSSGDVDAVRVLYGMKRVRTYGDFDGNGTTDWATWNAPTGWIFDNLASPNSKRWGEVGDKTVAGDYNGDQRTDRAVWRPSTGEWWIDVPGFRSRVWGEPGDIPVPEDYDGDGRTDRAVFRPSTGEWWIDVGLPPRQWGSPGDIPVPADYDGDGRADIAVWSPGTGKWHIYGVDAALQGSFGQAGDIPMPGDYVGEGRARAAVYRPGTGCWLLSQRQPFGNGGPLCFTAFQPGDVPAKGRYTGQIQEEPVTFRPRTGTFFTRTGAFRNRGPADSQPVF